MTFGETLEISELDNILFNEIKKIRDTDLPVLELRKELYQVANQHAVDFSNHVIQDIRDNGIERKKKFSNTRRFFEISFVSQSTSQITNSTQNEELTESAINSILEPALHILRNQFADQIKMAQINSIGPVALPLKSNKVVIVILGCFYSPIIPLKTFKRTFRQYSSSTVSSHDFNFFLELCNKFRSMIHYPKFEVQQDETKIQNEYKEMIVSSAQLSIQLFSELLTHPFFFDLLTEMWTGFNFEVIENGSENENEFKLSFTRNSDFYELIVRFDSNEKEKSQSQSLITLPENEEEEENDQDTLNETIEFTFESPMKTPSQQAELSESSSDNENSPLPEIQSRAINFNEEEDLNELADESEQQNLNEQLFEQNLNEFIFEELRDTFLAVYEQDREDRFLYRILQQNIESTENEIVALEEKIGDQQQDKDLLFILQQKQQNLLTLISQLDLADQDREEIFQQIEDQRSIVNELYESIEKQKEQNEDELVEKITQQQQEISDQINQIQSDAQIETPFIDHNSQSNDKQNLTVEQLQEMQQELEDDIKHHQDNITKKIDQIHKEQQIQQFDEREVDIIEQEIQERHEEELEEQQVHNQEEKVADELENKLVDDLNQNSNFTNVLNDLTELTKKLTDATQDQSEEEKINQQPNDQIKNEIQSQEDDQNVEAEVVEIEEEEEDSSTTPPPNYQLSHQPNEEEEHLEQSGQIDIENGPNDQNEEEEQIEIIDQIDIEISNIHQNEEEEQMQNNDQIGIENMDNIQNEEDQIPEQIENEEIISINEEEDVISPNADHQCPPNQNTSEANREESDQMQAEQFNELTDSMIENVIDQLNEEELKNVLFSDEFEEENEEEIINGLRIRRSHMFVQHSHVPHHHQSSQVDLNDLALFEAMQQELDRVQSNEQTPNQEQGLRPKRKSRPKADSQLILKTQSPQNPKRKMPLQIQ